MKSIKLSEESKEFAINALTGIAVFAIIFTITCLVDWSNMIVSGY